jgi:acyl-coenzyme A thioesterase PaaI-like protein
MKQNGLNLPPCTVTAEHNVKFKRPTPAQGTITMVARVVESQEDRAKVYGELVSGGKVCATCTSVFVAVKEGHPAFHRW